MNSPAMTPAAILAAIHTKEAQEARTRAEAKRLQREANSAHAEARKLRGDIADLYAIAAVSVAREKVAA